MTKYNATLKNTQGCIFDQREFSNMADLKAWARGRGGNYTLFVIHQASVEAFVCKNGRFNWTGISL